jgi:antitoxin component of RelBE/YafQ-DinJ toxin-antitoxin module
VDDVMTMQEKKKLTLRLNEQLIEQAKAYAAEHNISVSQLVEAYFLRLELDTTPEHTPLVQRLTGLLPADADVEQAYEAYLLEKYGR